MARVIVRSWQETYRGLMPDRVLDAPGLLGAREGFWTAAFIDERYRANRVAVAERDGELVGIAMAGPPEAPEPGWGMHLYVLYVLAAHHGTGAVHSWMRSSTRTSPRRSGSPIPIRGLRRSTSSTDSWPTGPQVEDGVREIRMVRISRDRAD